MCVFAFGFWPPHDYACHRPKLQASSSAREAQERSTNSRKTADREKCELQYAAAKKARAERGVGSMGLPDDVLAEVVLMSCPQSAGRLRSSSVELKTTVDANSAALWNQLTATRFPAAVAVARLCASPPHTAEDFIALYRRSLTPSVDAPPVLPASKTSLDDYIFRHGVSM